MPVSSARFRSLVAQPGTRGIAFPDPRESHCSPTGATQIYTTSGGGLNLGCLGMGLGYGTSAGSWPQTLSACLWQCLLPTLSPPQEPPPTSSPPFPHLLQTLVPAKLADINQNCAAGSQQYGEAGTTPCACLSLSRVTWEFLWHFYDILYPA